MKKILLFAIIFILSVSMVSASFSDWWTKVTGKVTETTDPGFQYDHQAVLGVEDGKQVIYLKAGLNWVVFPRDMTGAHDLLSSIPQDGVEIQYLDDATQLFVGAAKISDMLFGPDFGVIGGVNYALRVQQNYTLVLGEAAEACPDNYGPVCGDDNQTYGNSCEAEVAGVGIKCGGECPCEQITILPDLIVSSLNVARSGANIVKISYCLKNIGQKHSGYFYAQIYNLESPSLDLGGAGLNNLDSSGEWCSEASRNNIGSSGGNGYVNGINRIKLFVDSMSQVTESNEANNDKIFTFDTRVQTSCSDSDGGDDIYTKGTVSFGTNLYTDYCQSSQGNLINEYYCGDGLIKKNDIFGLPVPFATTFQYMASDKCSDDDPAIRLKEISSGNTLELAIRSDGSATLTVQGKLFNFKLQNCGPDDSPLTLIGEPFMKLTKQLCPNGCQNGACIKAEEVIELACDDSDGGLEYYTKGHAKGPYLLSRLKGVIIGEDRNRYTERNDPSIDYSIIYDTCFDSDGSDNPLAKNQIHEAYCDGNGLLQQMTYQCPDGCKDGVCLRKASLSNKPITLFRTVKDCATNKTVKRNEEGLKTDLTKDEWKGFKIDDAYEIQVIDLKVFRNGVYGNYYCSPRYYEQCILDGTFDTWYDEWCEYEAIKTEEPLGEDSFIFATDDLSGPKDVILLTDVALFAAPEIKGKFRSRLNSEIGKKDLDNKVTVFIYNENALIIIGEHHTNSQVALASKIISFLKNKGVRTISTISTQINSDDLRESIDMIGQEKDVTGPIAGGDKDKYGCIGSAGYTWCEAKRKCLREWEEQCVVVQEVPVCNGCLKEDNCLSFGTRLKEGGKPLFCDINRAFKVQSGEEEACNNNYECMTNLCIDSKCVSSGLINRIFMWFRGFFGPKVPSELDPCVKDLESEGWVSGEDYVSGQVLISFKAGIDADAADKILDGYNIQYYPVEVRAPVMRTAVVPEGSEFSWICKLEKDENIERASINGIVYEQGN